jgi:predicted Holliday junction resolvase-like endonuclease
VTESLAFVLLLILAAVVILVLIIMYVRLQAQTTDRAHQLTEFRTRAQGFESQLSARTHEFEQLQSQFNNRVQQLFVTWREREIESVREHLAKVVMSEARNAFQKWQMETEANIRADAIKRSSAVVAGQVTEHLIPYMGVFPYNPKDARFLGAPIDLIIFDGMSEGDLRGIIFLEVKTSTSTLSTRERRIRDAVVTGRVTWQELRIGG